MSGKGSASRPFSVDLDTYMNNWERIFSKNRKSIEDKLDESQEADDLNNRDDLGNHIEQK